MFNVAFVCFLQELRNFDNLTIGHFTVKDGSEADGDLALIQTFLLYHVNQFILMLTSIFQGQFAKQREGSLYQNKVTVSLKTRVLSPQP